MSERGHVERLHDMREAIVRSLRYTDGVGYDAFLADTKTQDAVIRNPQVIGEAAKQIPVEITSRYPDIEWQKVAGLRDRLVHHYFGVNWDIVWDVLTAKLDPLLERIDTILSETRGPSPS